MSRKRKSLDAAAALRPLDNTEALQSLAAESPQRRRAASVTRPYCRICGRVMLVQSSRPRAEGGRRVYFACDGAASGRPCRGRRAQDEDATGSVVRVLDSNTFEADAEKTLVPGEVEQ
jgi:hypothetical protein